MIFNLETFADILMILACVLMAVSVTLDFNGTAWLLTMGAGIITALLSVSFETYILNKTKE